jgi:hypothetical protein
MKEHFKPLPAESAGLITNYRCTFRCKHCLYCSSPGIEEDIEETALLEVINQIDHTLGSIPLHIGGGEPLIHFNLMKRILSYLKGTKIEVEYLESNGFHLIKDTTSKLKELRSAGLDCLLISISPFHNEFISVHQIKRIINEIEAIFGQRGVFPWHPGYLPFLEKGDTDKPVLLDNYFSSCSLSEILHQLTSVMYIHPGGRGAYLLAEHLPLRPAEELLSKTCAENLASPVHAHIDYQGNYLAGFCSGIRIGNQTGLELNRLYTEGIRLNRYPLLDRLVNGGLKELFDQGMKSEFLPDPQGYVSACHLCLDLRLHFFFQDKPYEELYPHFFYEDLRLLKAKTRKR